MILNEDVDFVRVAPDTDQKAFTTPPKRVLINDGTRIYRWTDYALQPGRVRPWWLFVESTTMPDDAVFDGFRAHAEYARRLGKTHREYARARLALSERFENTMKYVVRATLTVRVWAFWGVVSGQPEFKDKNLRHVYFIGGSHQLYIPNLAFPDHLRAEPIEAVPDRGKK